MDPEKWKLIKKALAEALELDSSEQATYLAGLDAHIRSDVERLVEADSTAEDFIESPIVWNYTESVAEATIIPERIDEYRPVSILGTGGMGTVFLAERARDGFTQKVAIKVIKRGMDTSGVLKRFLMERQILSNLDHPNIARLLGGGTTADGLPYFVMEYVDGVEIRRFCNENGYDLLKRLSLFQKICGAVSAAHRNLVIHRDLKPTNILVTKDGEPKLLDFGIAKLLSPDWQTGSDIDEATLTQMRVMTPEYASPEQIDGKATSTSSDVYSLGVILYELLAGRRPFIANGKSLREMSDAALSEEPPRPSSVVLNSRESFAGITSDANIEKTTPGSEGVTVGFGIDPKMLRGDLDNVILKAMRREPDLRYRSVQEFSDDIGRYTSGLPVIATAPSKVYRFKKFFRRHTAPVLAATAAATVLIIATGVTAWQYRSAVSERNIAERRFEETRSLARSVLYDLHDEIAKLPASTNARHVLVTKALEYLDKLAAEKIDDPYLQTELADAYQRIAEIQGGVWLSNLGQVDEAAKNYEKVLAIRESVVNSGVPEPKMKWKLAQAYSTKALWRMREADLPGYVENSKKAVDIITPLKNELGDDPDFLIDLVAAYVYHGRSLVGSGDLDQGKQYLQRGIDEVNEGVGRFPDSRGLKNARIIAYENMAEALFEFGEREKGVDMATMALADQRLLVDPLNTQDRRNLTTSLLTLALGTGYIGEGERSFAYIIEAGENCSNLLKEEPNNADLELVCNAVMATHGQLLVMFDRQKEGLLLLNEALKGGLKIAEDNPLDQTILLRNSGVQYYIGRANNELAQIAIGSAKRGHLHAAKESLEQAKSTMSQFASKGLLAGMDAEHAKETEIELAKCNEMLKTLR